MLKIEKISKSFGGIKALNNCSFKVKAGSITGLIGPNGSGKSTIFNTISRLYKEDQGDIFFENESIIKKPDYEVAKAGISRTFQLAKLFRNLTIHDHISIALNDQDEYLFHNLFKKEHDDTEKVKEMIKLVGLEKPLDTLATDLSYGQRKLLDLAMAIAKPHRIIMLDEPVAGVNPELRQKIANIIRKLNKKGETILLIEHDMNFMMGLAEYIYCMDQGKVIAEGTPKQIQNNKSVLNAYLGE